LIKVDDDPLLSCSWIRVLSDEEAGYGSVTRAIQIQYGYVKELRFYPEEMELWSDDYSSISEFLDDVERQPQFDFMLNQDYNFSGVHVREDDDEDDIVDE
jgi:hypothetical protein